MNYDLNFSKPALTIDPTKVDLNFGLGSGAAPALSVNFFHGESTPIQGLAVPQTIGPFIAQHGEALGDNSLDEKDVRNYPAILVQPAPLNLGLAHYQSGTAWPSGYTLTGSIAHTLSQAQGIRLKTAQPTPLVLPAIVAQVDYAGDGPRPVYAKTQEYLAQSQGEVLQAVLNIAWSSVQTQAIQGESTAIQILTAPVLTGQGPLVFGIGQSVVTDLRIEAFRPEAQEGQYVLASLDVYDLLAPQGYGGESASASLSTQSLLQNNLSGGENFSVVLQFHAASYCEARAQSGEVTSVSLATTQRIRQDILVGESAILRGLWLPERPGIEVNFGQGESASIVDLKCALGLGEIKFCDGVVGVVNEVAALPQYQAGSGESLGLETISVRSTVGAQGFDGQTANASLDTRQAEALSIRFFTGEELQSERPYVQKRAYLDITFFEGLCVECSEETATTSYDLADAPTRIETLEWFNSGESWPLEFLDGPPSWNYGSGTGIVASAELSTRARFAFNFFTGEHFHTERGYEFTDIDIQSGAVTTRATEWFYVEPRINLCYPNVIPNGDNVEVELDWREDTCYADADYAYAGESARASLSANKRFYPAPWTVGEVMTLDLSLRELWRLQVWTGQRMSFDLATTVLFAPAAFRTGESFKGTLEELTALAYTGQSVSASLEISYYVEFLETGCLENEYVPVDENGDPMPEKATTVCMEGIEFSHDIKARCY